MRTERKEDIYSQLLPPELFVPLDSLAIQEHKSVVDIIEETLATRVGLVREKVNDTVDTNDPLYVRMRKEGLKMGLSPEQAHSDACIVVRAGMTTTRFKKA